MGLGRAVPVDEDAGGPLNPHTQIDTNARRPRMRAFTGKGDCGEIESAFDADNARSEASRCLSCGVAFGRYRTCWFCLPCEIECPQQAINVEIPYLLR